MKFTKAPLRIGILAVLFLALYIVISPTDPSQVTLQRAQRIARAHTEQIRNDDYFVVIDYDRPIYRRRLWVIEAETGEVVLNEHVSHAWKSGFLFASEFSNKVGTEQSSAGGFVTAESYEGKYGYAMRIDGLDSGVNDMARNRAIVFHESYWPWSKGCFATWPDVNRELIDLVNDGRLVYVYRSE